MADVLLIDRCNAIIKGLNTVYILYIMSGFNIYNAYKYTRVCYIVCIKRNLKFIVDKFRNLL